MAKHIVEYKLHGGEIPYFIEDGGYYGATSNPNKLVGITKDSDCCHVPLNTLIELTNQEFIDRLVAMDLKTIVTEVSLTDAEKTTQAEAWLTDKGFM